MQYDVSMAWLLVWIVALLGLVEADEYSYSPQYMPSRKHACLAHANAPFSRWDGGR